jgi:hypothetical protein
MKKMKLHLDDLTVDTFHTTPAERERGTVMGQQCTCYTVCTCPGCATCDGTCPADASCADTCWETCDDLSCLATCGFTNCETKCNYTCRCKVPY